MRLPPARNLTRIATLSRRLAGKRVVIPDTARARVVTQRRFTFDRRLWP
jgi:hypothetical protein